MPTRPIKRAQKSETTKARAVLKSLKRKVRKDWKACSDDYAATYGTTLDSDVLPRIQGECMALERVLALISEALRDLE